MDNLHIQCTSCGTEVPKNGAFCNKCGKPLQTAAAEVHNAIPVPAYIEPSTVFAEGLPEWSIEPPSVVVRRKVRI
jgi:predicted amidophosphoribosyltransferase